MGKSRRQSRPLKVVFSLSLFGSLAGNSTRQRNRFDSRSNKPQPQPLFTGVFSPFARSQGLMMQPSERRTNCSPPSPRFSIVFSGSVVATRTMSEGRGKFCVAFSALFAVHPLHCRIDRRVRFWLIRTCFYDEHFCAFLDWVGCEFLHPRSCG